MSNLPKHAISLNGKWLDDEIEGFKTLSATGRELIDTEIATYSMENRDGNVFKTSRIPSRVITLEYLLTASASKQLPELFNQLNALLAVEQSTLIFADEPDKFFIGTKEKVNKSLVGSNSYVGKIDFYCADPFKYSIEQFTVPIQGDDFVIDYDGTEKSYPILEATMNGENGFIGFVNQSGALLQFGSPDEADGEDVENSETLINTTFDNANALNGWERNKANMGSTPVGIVAINTTRKELYASDYGSGTEYFGPSISRVIPPDKNDHVGAKNCTFDWTLYFAILNNLDIGRIVFTLMDKNGKNVARMFLHKNSQSTTGAMFSMDVWERRVKDFEIPNISTNNKITGAEHGRMSISKFGETVTFEIEGQKYPFLVPEIRDIEVCEIAVNFQAWGNLQKMSANILKRLRFTTHSVAAWNDIPNKFKNNETLSANCNDRKVSVDGVKQNGLGALGNDWERFYLKPGINEIKCLYSPWAQRPNFNMLYRKVWL